MCDDEDDALTFPRIRCDTHSLSATQTHHTHIGYILFDYSPTVNWKMGKSMCYDGFVNPDRVELEGMRAKVIDYALCTHLERFKSW